MEVDHANLQKGAYDNPNNYIPIFMMPASQNSTSNQPTTFKIIGESSLPPAKLNEYPLTLMATANDMIRCDS